jgi:hypothetical protein
MTGGWKYTAITFVLLAVLFAFGVCCAGLLSARGAIGISLMFGFLVSLFAAIGLAGCCYVKLRLHVLKYLDHPPLSDEEFAAALPTDVPIDLTVVQKTRQIAARRFRSLSGESFYPGDRLEADLHLSDLAPFAAEDFWFDCAKAFSEPQTDAAQVEIVTFGDVVLEANRRRREGTVP